MKKLITLIAALTLSASAVAEVVVDHPYARAVPPGQTNSAAFMSLTNDSNDEVALVAASTSIAKVVELHTHTHDNGVMKMRQIPRITLPAHQTVELQPGGLHIMLIGLKRNLVKDEMIDLTLTYNDGHSEQLTIPVTDIMAGMNHKKMDHSQMNHKMKNHSSE
ncbi:copper chaperone PCu(A)C [Amphritea sp. 1_MG-2023]|uniref:copper chaperone PCu(A)C n=1 Tax=Amphritea sp. 1_MG-2023 TaxID=3062670 RepID=UPI0026E1BCED|nr:copper chaperone PCu(A)C [Amphritea sp. 1_MG-2023]MDO6564951.1 copper chaperone PCu(A)C [Amphritea sp. 1_MG-2023]